MNRHAEERGDLNSRIPLNEGCLGMFSIFGLHNCLNHNLHIFLGASETNEPVSVSRGELMHVPPVKHEILRCLLPWYPHDHVTTCPPHTPGTGHCLLDTSGRGWWAASGNQSPPANVPSVMMMLILVTLTSSQLRHLSQGWFLTSQDPAGPLPSLWKAFDETEDQRLNALSHLGDILDQELCDEIPGGLRHAILPLTLVTCHAWSQRWQQPAKWDLWQNYYVNDGNIEHSEACCQLSCVPGELLVNDHVVQGVDVRMPPGRDPCDQLVHQHPQGPPVHTPAIAWSPGTLDHGSHLSFLSAQMYIWLQNTRL